MNPDQHKRNPDDGVSSSVQSASSADDLSSPPIPPRYWWLKRLLIASGCLLVALALLRVWWGHHAQSLLDAEITGYRAAGQLVFAREFDELLDAIPDEDNVALAYDEAMKLHSILPIPFNYYWMMEPGGIAQAPNPVRKMIEAHAGVFDLMREIRGEDQANWRVLDWPEWGGGSLPYSLMRQLTEILVIHARWQMHTGDHAGTIATIEDALRFGEALETDPLLISNYAALSFQRQTLSVIGEYSLVLQIEGPTGPRSDSRPASRENVEALIEHLLDETRSRRSYAQMWHGERASVLSDLETLAPGTAPGGPAGPGTVVSIVTGKLTLPLIKMDLLRAVLWYASMADGGAKGSWRVAIRGVSRDPEETSFVQSLTRFLTPLRYNLNTTTLSIFHRYMAKRRMAAIALAIRLYELDHGERPAALALLVPDYLPAVPVDPFSPDSGPIRYIRDLDPPILYSVYRDGEDNKGHDRFAPVGPSWVGMDSTLYLGPKPNSDEEP